MKARYFLIGGFLCLLVAWVLPFALYEQLLQEGAESLGDILWLIVAPGVLCQYAWPFWIAGVVLLVVAVGVYIHGKVRG